MVHNYWSHSRISPQVSGSSHTPAQVSLHCDQLRRCQGRRDRVERFQSARLVSDGVTTGSARNTEKEPRCQSREGVSCASKLCGVNVTLSQIPKLLRQRTDSGHQCPAL